MLFSDFRSGARLGRLPLWARYLIGLALYGIALASRFALVGILPATGFPFLTFFPAVLLTTYLSGLGAGLLVSALSVLSAWYFFIGPPASFVGLTRADVIALIFFAAILVVDCVVIHFMNAAIAAVQRRENKLREQGEALRESEEKYRTLFMNVNEGFAICQIVFDEQERPFDYLHVLVNPAFERLGGHAAGTVNGKTARELVPDADPAWLEMFAGVALSGEPAARDERIDSTGRWYSARAFVLERGKFAFLLADVTESKHAQERVRQAALHDPLTGLPNRALIFEYGRHLLAASRRNHGRGALLFIDLDRFKPINDLHGHETGDLVLKEVARRLLACTREEDLAGRLGGDEFVVIFPHMNDEQQRAVAVARHLIDSISKPFRVNELELSLSPSIGISWYPDHAADMNSLIHTADMAMYEAKRAGRANFQFYSPEINQRAEQALRMEDSLRNALRQGSLRLHYQPVVDVGTGRLIGAEALVRMIDSDGTQVMPDRFIPVAEASGLIGDVGEWVAAEACRQHKAWVAEGLELTIAINVSPVQFRQRRFADRLSNIIAAAGIDPVNLEIEVTESTVMENIEQAIRILNDIKSLGVKVALDDFGTGHSSLATLTSLPLDKLKVDQSFVQRVERDAASRAVTAAIIALGRSLRLDVHGEGIESESALRYLKEQGCNQAQGFWFSEPLPPAEFADWCRNVPPR